MPSSSARRRPPPTCWTPSSRPRKPGPPRPGSTAAELHRKAQWRLDFVAAQNSMGFHAPQELARILGEAIDYARQGQRAAETASRK